jgi:hypothetical protein
MFAVAPCDYIYRRGLSAALRKNGGYVMKRFLLYAILLLGAIIGMKG